MCILCVLQEVSGKAKAMLPWLVIALAALWAFSQLLPPPFRIDMTTARVACFLFLVAVVFWQRVLRPQLCLWQARRSARLRERRWTEAVELQKLRKIAVRRCRNCLTAYRDQNPGGGKFMCGYCGHVSKRPVLDIPGSDVVGKNGPWNCHQDWEGRYWVSAGSGDDQCLTGKSYSGAAVLISRLVCSIFLSMRWVCGKVFGAGSNRENGSLDRDHKGLSKKGDGGGGYQESKGEKARRKAEEKRQARLEKEMLEEEERKQREEVARLIEERRKLRDEKSEAEKEHLKGSYPEKGRGDARKESEKRKHEKRKDKDKSSSKSNSDGEELEKRTSRESERKREFDRKSDSEKRDFQKACIENIRTQISEGTIGTKTNTNKPRYFDRVAGSFLSSSRGFSGANFFGRGNQSSTVTVTKPNKPTMMPVEQANYVNRREGYSSGHVTGTHSVNGEDKSAYQQPVISNPPATNVWKKSWHQLFTCSSAVSPSPDAKGTNNLTQSVHSTKMKDHQALASFPPLNQIDFGQSLPFTVDPVVNDSFGSKKIPPFGSTSLHPRVGDKLHDSVSDEAELFEDPCYVPDPVALLGPVSESLDNFPVDLGSGFVANAKMESSPVLRSVSTAADVGKPSPIESPMSRLRMSREKPSPIGQIPGSPKARDSYSSLRDESVHTSEQGTWQMWGTPLGLDPLAASRLLPVGQHNKLNQEDIMHPLFQNNILPYVVPKDNHVYSGTHSSLKFGTYQKDGTFSPLALGINEDNSWLQKKAFEEFPGDAEKNFPLNLEQFPSDWSKAVWVSPTAEDAGSVNLPRPHIGSLFPTNPDVQSVWSFK